MQKNQYLALLASVFILSACGTSGSGGHWKDNIRGDNPSLKSSSNNNSSSNDANLNKKFSVGVTAYNTTIATTFSNVEDVEFNGPAIFASYGISDNIGIRASLFSLESETNGALTTTQSDGYDLSLHFGTGLETDGFKAYGGFGLFKDKWSGATNYTGSLSFGGLQIGGGLGYNWENLSLDANINLRKASEYREVMDFMIANSPSSFGSSGTGYGLVVSPTLTLSYRF